MNRIVLQTIRCSIVTVVLLVGAVASAQFPAQLDKQPIVSIEIDGVMRGLLSASSIPLRVGDLFTRNAMRYLSRELFQSGQWKDVQLEAVPVENGVRVLITLIPIVTVQRTEVRFNRVISDEEIIDILGAREQSPLDEKMLREQSKALYKKYYSLGYTHASVRWDLRETDDPFRKVLIIRVSEGIPQRVASLQTIGKIPRAAQPIIRQLDVEAGAIARRNQIAEIVLRAQENLRDHGYLEATIARPHYTDTNPTLITVNVYVGPHYTVKVSGIRTVSKQDLVQALDLYKQSPTQSGQLKRMQSAVVQLLQRHGHLDAKVDVTREKHSENEVELFIDIVAGPRVQVTAILFRGHQDLKEDELHNEVVSVLQEELPHDQLLQAVDSETVDLIATEQPARSRDIPEPVELNAEQVYYPPAYEIAQKKLEQLYQSRGFRNAKIQDAKLVRMSSNRAKVVIDIEEGPQTLLYKVDVVGNSKVPKRDILEASELEIGKPFSYLEIEQAIVRIRAMYQNRGYYFARVEEQSSFSDDETRGSVELEIVEGFEVRVGQIIVRGNEKTLSSLIRQRLSFGPGDLMRPSEIAESQSLMNSVGIFSAVSIQPEDPQFEERIKRIVVTVREKKPQYLETSIGFSTGEGARGGIEYGYRNLFGYGVGITWRARLAYQLVFLDPTVQERIQQLNLANRLERRLSATLNLPHIAITPRVRLAVDLVHLRDNERDFGYDKNGATFSQTYNPLLGVTWSLAQDFEQNNVDLFVAESLDELRQSTTNTRLARLLRVPDGESMIVAIRSTLAFDTRDNAFVPTSGIYTTLTGEWARTLETENDALSGGNSQPFFSHFIKGSFSISGYISPWKNLVLASQLRAGRVFHLNSESQTYPNRQFFMGGVDTMRAYLQDAMVPEDLAQEIRKSNDPNLVANAVFRGGDSFVLLREELRFPIVGVLHGAVFGELGNLWADASRIDLLTLRPTAGVGLRIATPVGPIAADYGFLLLRRSYLQEGVGAFHFSIGVF